MRRRKKPVVNESESTGKIGHELPQDQPTPLQPSYSHAPAHEEPAAMPAPATHEADVFTDVSSGDDRPETSLAVEALPAAEPASRNEGRSQRNQDRSQGRNRGGRNQGRLGGRGRAAVEPAPEAAPQEAAEGHTLVHETQPESLAQPPAPLEAARSPKGYVVLAIGLPGSGKTTWFKRRGVTPLSSDMLRTILFDDITEQRYQGLVFSTLRSLLRARLIAKMPWNYVDATNLSPHERRQWIKMARSFGYEVHAVFFDVPFEVCMERNSRRDRMVNQESMAKMQERLRPPSFKEGFHKITVVRVKSDNAGAAPVV